MVFITKNRKKAMYVPLEGERKDQALSLIANMIVTKEQADKGMLSRLSEQGGYSLKPEMLHPTGMPFERLVLRVLYTLEAQKMPALFDNILQRVRAEYDDAETRLIGLMNYRTEPPDVISIAFGLGDWIETQKMILAAKQIVERMQSAEGSSADKFNDSMDIMSSIAPLNMQMQQNDMPGMYSNWERVQHDREKRLAEGRSNGPNFPWKGLNKKVPGLKAGELCTIMAKSSHGKSVMAILLAEHMAHVQGYDVALFHLETSETSIMDRIVSKNLRVQSGALRHPEVFKLSNPDHAVAYAAAKEKYLKLDAEVGSIISKPSAGITPSALRAECAKLLAASQARGKELVVIIDYYQEIDWSELAREETAGYNAVASYLKNMSETLAAGNKDFYLVAFSQYGVDQEYGSKKAGFGGQKIVQRSQVVIRLERDEAVEDQPVFSGKNSKGENTQVKDLIGVPMFYHQAGDASSDAYLNIIKANDDGKGVIPVKFVNAYYLILDHPNEKVMRDMYFSKRLK